jgi:cytochrome c-type protein NapB
VVVIALAMAGFVVGTVGSARRAQPLVDVEVPPAAPRALPEGVAPSSSYAEMAQSALGPNRAFRTTIAGVAPPQVSLATVALPPPEVKLASLERRATRRAYNGAPPVIPHAVDQLEAESCMSCHEHGLRVGNVAAARIPHPYMTNCTQCHVEGESRALPPFVLAENSFQGLPAPTQGPRAWPGAPPIVPHSTLMRSDCLSCHGPLGPEGMRTTHPWRAACLQCHAPSAQLDQYAVSESPRFLAPPIIVDQ